jgi:hypothetical protein
MFGVLALLFNFVSAYTSCYERKQKAAIYKQKYVMNLEICWYDSSLTQGYIQIGYHTSPHLVYTALSQCLINHRYSYQLPPSCDRIAQAIGTYFYNDTPRTPKANVYRFDAEGDLYRISLLTRTGVALPVEYVTGTAAYKTLLTK